ncbi:MAG: hypothetical protein VX672_07730 [Planctomycetota bacterium]|nr:hypothetical protein [Planctomycetota bacterium]
MMDSNDHNRTDRLRSVLKRMERSIDDARHRRTNGSDLPVDAGSSAAEDTVIGVRTPSPSDSKQPFDSLDTPIQDTRPAATPGSSKSTVVRDERTMFDFEGPRLKARPKRRTAS